MPSQSQSRIAYSADQLPVPGSISWTDIGNTQASDDQYARCTIPGGGIPEPVGSTDLRLYDFRFDIPPLSRINGIELHIERKYTRSGSTSATVVDGRIQLHDGSQFIGEDKAGAHNWTLNTDTVDIYGGNEDIWGASLTASLINSSEFGIVIRAKRQGNIGNEASITADIDHVVLTVHYTTYDDPVECDTEFPITNLVRVENGTSPSHIVRSRQVTCLQNAMVSVETALLTPDMAVRALGDYSPGMNTLVLFAIMATGVIPASGVVFFEDYWTEMFVNGSSYQRYDLTITSGITSVQRTKIPAVVTDCFMVSSIGWVTAAGVKIPAYVDGRCAFFHDTRHNPDGILSFYLGFRACGHQVASSVTLYEYNNYVGPYIRLAQLPPGNLTVKMLAVGRM